MIFEIFIKNGCLRDTQAYLGRKKPEDISPFDDDWFCVEGDLRIAVLQGKEESDAWDYIHEKYPGANNDIFLVEAHPIR